MIFAHEQSQSIREFEFLDLTSGKRFHKLGLVPKRTLWIQRDDRQVILGQICFGDALHVIKRHFLNRIQVMTTEIEIARE